MTHSLSSRKIKWTLGNPNDDKPKKKAILNQEEYFEEYPERTFTDWEQHSNQENSSFDLSEIMSQDLIQFPKRKLWIGSTNWRIKEEDFLAMRAVNGVELLKCPATYTFIMSPAILFDDEEVRLEIEIALGAQSD